MKSFSTVVLILFLASCLAAAVMAQDADAPRLRRRLLPPYHSYRTTDSQPHLVAFPITIQATMVPGPSYQLGYATQAKQCLTSTFDALQQPSMTGTKYMSALSQTRMTLSVDHVLYQVLHAGLNEKDDADNDNTNSTITPTPTTPSSTPTPVVAPTSPPTMIVRAESSQHGGHDGGGDAQIGIDLREWWDGFRFRLGLKKQSLTPTPAPRSLLVEEDNAGGDNDDDFNVDDDDDNDFPTAAPTSSSYAPTSSPTTTASSSSSAEPTTDPRAGAATNQLSAQGQEGICWRCPDQDEDYNYAADGSILVGEGMPQPVPLGNNPYGNVDGGKNHDERGPDENGDDDEEEEEEEPQPEPEQAMEYYNPSNSTGNDGATTSMGDDDDDEDDDDAFNDDDDVPQDRRAVTPATTTETGLWTFEASLTTNGIHGSVVGHPLPQEEEDLWHILQKGQLSSDLLLEWADHFCDCFEQAVANGKTFDVYKNWENAFAKDESEVVPMLCHILVTHKNN